MVAKMKTLMALTIVLLGLATSGLAQEVLRVATKDAPPFAMKGEDGAWTGLAIEMFTSLAEELGYQPEFQEATLADMVAGTADGRFDAAVAAMSITPERETVVDFSYPYFSTGLGMAVPANRDSGGWMKVVANFFSWQFLGVIGTLAAILMAAGALVWVFERRNNTDEFSTDARGILDGFWWAAVTMTTVGYGDKSPRTLGGRFIGLIWMFTALIIVASFTASITASLTVGRLSGQINSFDDLGGASVGAIAGSTAERALLAKGITPQGFNSVTDGFTAMSSGQISAFVHDRPLLLWVASRNFQGEVEVLGDLFGHEDYGIVLPQGSPLRESINRQLLLTLRSDEWQALVTRYLGER